MVRSYVRFHGNLGIHLCPCVKTHNVDETLNPLKVRMLIKITDNIVMTFHPRNGKTYYFHGMNPLGWDWEILRSSAAIQLKPHRHL